MKILRTASLGSTFTGSYKKECIFKSRASEVFKRSDDTR